LRRARSSSSTSGWRTSTIPASHSSTLAPPAATASTGESGDSASAAAGASTLSAVSSSPFDEAQATWPTPMPPSTVRQRIVIVTRNTVAPTIAQATAASPNGAAASTSAIRTGTTIASIVAWARTWPMATRK
jgi:hypothetical protein